MAAVNKSDDANRWRHRAEEARAIAVQMKDAHTKAIMLAIAQDYDKLAVRGATRRKAVARLSHFLDDRFWRPGCGGSKFSARSTLKPNLAQLGVVLAHAHIAGFMRPLETFIRQFPIVSGRRHRARPSLGPPQQ